MADCPALPDNPELEIVCRAADAAERAAAAAEALAARSSSMADWSGLIQALGLTLLPVAAVVLLWNLYGPIREIVGSRKFTIKIGPFELSAQEAAEQLGKQIEDLQRKVVELEAGRAAPRPIPTHPKAPFEPSPFGPVPSPPPTPLEDPFADRVPRPAARPAPGDFIDSPLAGPAPPPATLNILWVDDRPQNNAFEIAALEEAGHRIRTVRSSGEAEAALRSGRIDAILSDMGRPEGRNAGLELLRKLRAAGDRRPYGFYSSSASLARNDAEIAELDAFVATSSFVELLAAVRALAARPAP
jgi:CheY-like chemotaxis protein